jgi:DNA modification methylase
MSVRIITGDSLSSLRALPDASFDCVVTSPPYWGLRSYIPDGNPLKKFEIGLEPTLGEHLDVLVGVFREIRRVLKLHGTLWLNYGDCYAAKPNGKAAAEYAAEGNDDRTHRDKPFSTVGPIDRGKRNQSRWGGGNAPNGPIYQPDSSIGGQRGDPKRLAIGGAMANGRVTAGGYLKPKDLCMVANRLAIALQEDGWWVRSEIIWHKPNPMPESVYDRPTVAHEKIWLLTKGEEYFYNHAAIREPVSGGTHARVSGASSRENVDRIPRSRKKLKVPGGWDVEPGAHGTINRSGRTSATYVDAPGVTPKSAAEGQPYVKAKGSFHASTTAIVDSRNARNVWTIAPRAFSGAHFATFPPALAERCLKAGCPPTVCGCCGAVDNCGGLCEGFARVPGRVLDPFGGAGTVAMVAEQLGLDCTLIELNPESVTLAADRLAGRKIAAAAE